MASIYIKSESGASQLMHIAPQEVTVMSDVEYTAELLRSSRGFKSEPYEEIEQMRDISEDVKTSMREVETVTCIGDYKNINIAEEQNSTLRMIKPEPNKIIYVAGEAEDVSQVVESCPSAVENEDNKLLKYRETQDMTNYEIRSSHDVNSTTKQANHLITPHGEKCDVCGKVKLENQQKPLMQFGNVKVDMPPPCDAFEENVEQVGQSQFDRITHGSEKQHSYDLGDKLFSQVADMHAEEHPNRCDVCGKCFTSVYVLKTHKNVHTREKLYSCDVCEKSFTSIYVLRTHEKIHTRKQLHRCDVCGKRYTSVYVLETHKNIHAGEKMHSCDVCGKSFASIHVLKTHKKIHTRDELHRCDVCGKQYTSVYVLKTHKKIHAR